MLNVPWVCCQVLGRIFPVRRGLYEDYLANWWCVTSLAIKWKQLASNALLMRVCAAATLAAAAPSMVQQIRAPTRRGLLLALANSGYAFFMFSYQVRLALSSRHRGLGMCIRPAMLAHTAMPPCHSTRCGRVQRAHDHSTDGPAVCHRYMRSPSCCPCCL
jgi:hypothetical protein